MQKKFLSGYCILVFCDLVGAHIAGPAFLMSLQEMGWGSNQDVWTASLVPNDKFIRAYPSFRFRLNAVDKVVGIEGFGKNVRHEFQELFVDPLDELSKYLSGIETNHSTDRVKVSANSGSDVDRRAIENALEINLQKQDHGLEKALDHRLVELAQPALQRREKVSIEMPIRNVNRTVGTILSSEVARLHGHAGLPDDTIHVKFAGSAGQSFGAFLAQGITLDLIGEANDYVGKGLSGGRISVQPSPKFRGKPGENIIVGNTVLYGAIAGEAYFRGVGGERFAVRNSGAHTVVEGVGDHGCEYMTGGTVVVLGGTGRNFAAGMSGGIAYVLDEDGTFKSRCNLSMVSLEPVLAEAEQEGKVARGVWHLGESDESILRRLVERHAKFAGSARAREILDNWAAWRAKFVKVFPNEYKRALGELAAKGRKLAA